MKRFLLFLIGVIVFSSCDLFRPYKETEYVDFSLNNTGQSIYQHIIVYAKDSNKSLVDSSANTIYNPTDKDWPTVPNSRGISAGIVLENLKDVKKGVFEVEATMLNGKYLSKEFGVIDGFHTQREFRVELKDSTIVIK